MLLHALNSSAGFSQFPLLYLLYSLLAQPATLTLRGVSERPRARDTPHSDLRGVSESRATPLTLRGVSERPRARDTPHSDLRGVSERRTTL